MSLCNHVIAHESEFGETQFIGHSFKWTTGGSVWDCVVEGDGKLRNTRDITILISFSPPLSLCLALGSVFGNTTLNSS